MKHALACFCLALNLLLFPVAAIGATQIDIAGPVGSGFFGTKMEVLPNGNVVVADPYYDYFDPGSGWTYTDVGAVRLYSPTGVLISELRGSTGSDHVGSSVVVLGNGNYVVVSREWTNGFGQILGAVTWCDGTKGMSGVVSVGNSLVGVSAGDNVGSGGVTALPRSDGNYIVCSPNWKNATKANAGAVTWCNGTTGRSGQVTAANSLVGGTAGDLIGDMSGLSQNVAPLKNGNYLMFSPSWHNGAAANAGAVTWGNGASGVVGVVSASNSLVGTKTNDKVGNGWYLALANGHYVVTTPDWGNGSAIAAGAVTWGDGTTGVVGAVSASNSLVGSTSGDGGSGNDGTTCYAVELTNGHYVTVFASWDNGAVANVGAVTWCSGTSGRSGAVSTAISLVGSTSGDGVGWVVPLTNGNYVVAASSWDNGAVTDVGAVIWCNGTSGRTGTIIAANALVGSVSGDVLGGYGVTPLTNGHYVVAMPNWYAGGTAFSAGAVTWCSGTAGRIGTVSAANSLVGTAGGDWVGGEGVFALSNGNYVVNSPYWKNGAAAEAGAVTWCDGTAGKIGAVTAANSLVGSKVNDRVGSLSYGVTPLTNGNYVVSSVEWDNGAVADVGAATWCSGTTGRVGAVGTGNSVYGSTANDKVGFVTALGNGSYIVRSPLWNNAAIVDAGAVTWCDGSTGRTGSVSSANSLVGSTANDLCGDSAAYPTAFGNGSYLVENQVWDNGAAVNAGAISLGRTTGTFGAISAANSVTGSVANRGGYMSQSSCRYDATRDLFVVPQSDTNIVSLFTYSTAPIAGTLSATNVFTLGATLNGSVRANGTSTTVTFEYGLTTSYGQTAAASPSPVTGSSATAVSASISGLQAATTYHYRVKTVGAGTAYGADVVFTTANAGPEIVIEQPAGTSLVDGTASIYVGGVTVGNPAVTATFTIRNTGTAALNVGAITRDGTNAADFTINTTGMATSVPIGGSTTFVVSFNPAATGNKIAVLHIANDDADENPFDITLTALAAGNTPPTISDVPDSATNEDTPTAAIPFTISDPEADPAMLSMSLDSSNRTLVPLANITISGGANRTVAIIPAVNQTGTTTITLYVHDGPHTVSDTFVLTVNPVNDPPTITGTVAGQTVSDTGTKAPFTGVSITDVDTPTQTLTTTVTLDIAAKGSFTTLNGFTIAGGGAYTFSGTSTAATTAIRGLVFTPTANRVTPGATETTTFTIGVSDGVAATVSDSVTTVITTSINNTPTIGEIYDVFAQQGAVVPVFTVIVADVDPGQTATLSVSATSSNPSLVPNPVVTGTGGTRSLTLAPAANQTGSAVITVTVSDGTLSASDTFKVTVGGSGLYSQLVNDPFTDGSRTGGADAGGVVWYQSLGGTLLSVVDDSGGIATGNALRFAPNGSFQKVVAFFGAVSLDIPGDTLRLEFDYRFQSAPSSLADGMRFGLFNSSDTRQTTDAAAATIRYDDKGYLTSTNPGDVVANSTGVKSEDGKVPGGSDILGGNPPYGMVGFGTTTTSLNSGTTKHHALLMITRQANGDLKVDTQLDTAGTASGTVAAANVLTYKFDQFGFGFGGSGYQPVLLDNVVIDTYLELPEIVVEQPAGIDIVDGGSRSFGVANVGTNADFVFTLKNTGNGDLTLSGTPRVLISGTDATHFSVITQPSSPVSGPSGATTFTVRFSPTGIGVKTALLSIASNDLDQNPFDITLTGTGVSSGPSISDITNTSTGEDTPTVAIAFSIADVDTPTASLTVTGTSSNSALVTDANIFFGGSGTSRTLTVLPLFNQNGSTTITVTVSDGTATATDTFVLTVNAANDPPMIGDIADRTIFENASTGTLAFTVGDLDTDPASLTLSKASTNTALVPTANIALGGSGTSRTVVVTPVAGQSGSATITVTVSDGAITAADSFLLTVAKPGSKCTLVDFNTGALTDNFFVNLQSAPSPYSLAANGLAGTQGVDLSANTSDDATLVFKNKSFNLAALTSLEVSCFFKKQPTSAGTNPLTLGLTGASGTRFNAYNDTATLEDAWLGLKLNRTTSGTPNLLQFSVQSKVGNSASPSETFHGTPQSLTTGNWYQLRASFVRVDASTIRVSGTLYNANVNGDVGSAVVNLPQVDRTITDLASDSALWVALRGFGAAGADAWDNLMITEKGGDAMVPNAPSNLSLSVPSTYRTELSWTDNSLTEDGFVILRRTQPTGPFTQVGSTGADVIRFTDTTYDGFSTCYYVVRATNSAGDSTDSNVVGRQGHAPATDWKNVAIGGGGYVTGVFIHPTERDLVYIRTDVGGFYRWDTGSSRWIPLMDHLTLTDVNFYGGDSLALDKNDPNVVYVSCGTYLTSTDGAIFKSHDRGATWTKLSLTGVKMGGNDTKRNAGERLVVSPHDSNILLFGTRSHGLWRSGDAGANWTKIAAFPGVLTATYGITSLAFDPQPASAGVIYAAAYGDTVYRSTDNGLNWGSLSGGPAQVNRLAVGSNGILFATHQGGVSRYAPGAWTLSVPTGAASPLYGLSVNPTDPNDVLVAEGEADNTRIYRSLNGGSSWTQVTRTTTTTVPWWGTYMLQLPHLAALEFDPTVPGQVWATDWFGIWRTDNINAATPAFTNLESGHEEVVTFALAAPSSGPLLISGFADDDGFVHNNGLDAFPTTRMKLPSGGEVQETYGISVWEGNPARVARAVGQRTTSFKVLTSANGGVTWAPTNWDQVVMPLRIAISASDPDNFVVVASASAPKVTFDNGDEWQTVTGLPNGPTGPWTSKQPITADRQLAGVFYYHDGSGIVYRSTDGGLNFAQINTTSVLPSQSWSMIKTLPGTAGEVWTCLDSSGLYRSTDGGVTFAKLVSVDRAHLFAFGKPPTGSTTPALYVYGRVGGSSDGVFRSLDLGQTWAEISDPRKAMGDNPQVMEASPQQFGLVFVGTGGRGIYYGQAVTASPEIAVAQPVGVGITSSGSRSFGNVNVGAQSEMTFTINNTGSADLTLIGTPRVAVSGADAAHFTVTTQPDSSVSGSSGTTTFMVRFAPTGTGSKTAALSIANNDADENPFDITLTGTGVDPLQQPSPPAAPVVNPQTGLPEQPVTINNVGTGTTGGVQFRIDGVPDGVTVVGGTYVPGAAGAFSAKSEESDAAASPSPSSGYWLLDYGSIIGGGQNATIVIQYSFTGAPVAFIPTITITPPPATPGPADPQFASAVQGLARNLTNGNMTLLFRTVPGRSYRVEFSTDLVIWNPVTGPATSRGSFLDWTDDGASTGTTPGNAAKRFYHLKDVTP